ncbi:interferon-induced, double-stranded RNA-activated protein kinase-like [Hydractinia symbiolongicarpus]|uniref:interferon-induced, double-stranded RNA-activated protein kinase-like n=1 Tax=Hydractinia symbiolongicarpus TaxID=13093 RepID=UPI00254DC683|nr:interferon-induced, double-stranded RNA-activated protein kinase-like [Hydractinia symbiolongicarpus]
MHQDTLTTKAFSHYQILQNIRICLMDLFKTTSAPLDLTNIESKSFFQEQEKRQKRNSISSDGKMMKIISLYINSYKKALSSFFYRAYGYLTKWSMTVKSQIYLNIVSKMYSLWNSLQLVDIKYAFSMHQPSRSWIDKMHDSGTYSYFNNSIKLSIVAARSPATDSLSSLQVQFNSSFVSLGSIVSLESLLHTKSCILTQSVAPSNSPKELVIPELTSDMTNARFDAAFKVMQYLGGGAFGRVFKAEVKETKEEVVIKFLKRETAELPDEVKFMRQLCHPNIVEYRCVSANMEYVQIVMSCHGQKSASFEAYRSCLFSFSETMLMFFARQFLAGINYIHRKGVAHMDLKEANVIINNKLQIKIIDFGLSIQALDPGFHRPKYDSFGTSLYMSPELHF